MVGRHFATFLAPSSYTQATRIFQDVVALGERIKALELELTRADGSTFIGELDGTRFHIGEEHGTLGVLRDVSDRKRAERETEESRLLLRAVIDLIPDPVFAKDTAGAQDIDQPPRCGRFLELRVRPNSSASPRPRHITPVKHGWSDLRPTTWPSCKKAKRSSMPRCSSTWPAAVRLGGWCPKSPCRTLPAESLPGGRQTMRSRTKAGRTRDASANRQLLRTVFDLLPDAIYCKDEAARKILLEIAPISTISRSRTRPMSSARRTWSYSIPIPPSGFYATICGCYTRPGDSQS